ncbi:MAG: SAM-dependent methyltransferase [Steroidobacteraceae bacterium]
MPFTLADVVPWGRSFDEYVAMFALGQRDLEGTILGCGDGPAAFNAAATERGSRVVSVDPIYEFSAEEVERRIEQTTQEIAEQTRRNAAEFVWTHFKSVEELIAARRAAMRRFVQDFPAGLRAGRYINGSLPALPFGFGRFQLALCSHFLFLYSDKLDFEFHLRSVLALCGVAREVRIFPLFELGSRPSRHIDPVMDSLRELGFRADRVRVDYEFQRGANEMLTVKCPTEHERRGYRRTASV